MPSDYAKISADNTVKYGTEVSYYGSDFADRYTERTHFIFELLQNAEDALRWREEAEPGANFPRTVTFRLKSFAYDHGWKALAEAEVST